MFFLCLILGIPTNAFARPIILHEDDYSSNYFKWLMNEEIRSQFSSLIKDFENIKYDIGQFEFSSGKVKRTSEINRETVDHHLRVLEIRSSHKSFKLYLKKQSDMIAPSMTVRYGGIEYEMNAEEMNNCLFEGTVWSVTDNETGTAAISTCDNGLLTGIISTVSSRYVIGPLPLRVREKRQIPSEKIVIVELSDSTSHHCCAVKCMPIPNIEDKSAEARRKFVAKRRTIETAVFVDQPMAEWAARNSDANPTQAVINLVLTIMNGVQTVFNNPSLEIRFNFVLVLIEVIEDNQDAPHAADGQINVYLNNFCNWQNDKKLARAKKGLPSWDHGLLLSGRELHTDEDQKRSAGLSWVSGMCRETLSCSINDGSSFNAIHVISHQIGHNLGMVHDGKGNSCPSDAYLMSPALEPAKASWSTCSNDYSYVYLAQQYADCLDNEAESNSKLNFSNAALPGQLFSADKQCEIAFGASFHPHIVDQTPFENICRELWCANDTHVKKSHPALLGTTCDQLKICNRGECVAQSSTTEIAFLTSESSTTETNTLTTVSPSGTATLTSAQNTQLTTFMNTQPRTSTLPIRQTTTSSDRSTFSSSNGLSTIVSTTIGNSLTYRTSISTLTPTLNPTTETSIASISKITTSSPSMTPYIIPPSNETNTSNTERFGTIASTINVPTRTISSPSITPYRIPPRNESNSSTTAAISIDSTQATSTTYSIPFRTTSTSPPFSRTSSSLITNQTQTNYVELTTSATRISAATTVPLFDIIIDNMNNKNSNKTENGENDDEEYPSIDIRILNNQTEL